jgi:hypothetical protein
MRTAIMADRNRTIDHPGAGADRVSTTRVEREGHVSDTQQHLLQRRVGLPGRVLRYLRSTNDTYSPAVPTGSIADRDGELLKAMMKPRR